MRPSKTLSLRFAALALAAWVAAMDAASAQDAARKYQIQEQSLGQALREFALASNLDLLFSPDLVADKKSASLDGKFTVDQGLRTLLRGSGLEFSISGSRVVISEAKEAPARQATSPTSTLNGTNGYTRLAQADVAERSPGSTSDPSSTRDEVPQSLRDRIALEEIVVTGTNIRGVYPTSSPVHIYTAEDIRRTGATTTEQFIGKLPQNFATISPYGSGSASREAVSGIDLRGLGVGTTLVLMNGRRLSSASRGRTADISMIPASAIARVEVLTDGASAIYGSDAIGGVVNFVLREDFERAETRLAYGGNADGGLNQGGVTQTFGRQWNSGHVLISYDFLNADALARTARDYSRASAPGTLTPDDERHNLLATFSQHITDRLTVGGDVVLGQRDIESGFSQNMSSTNPLNHLLNTDATEVKQNLFNLGVDYDLTDSLRASLDASYSKNETERNSVATRFNNPNIAPIRTRVLNDQEVRDLTAMLDGSLFTIAGGDVRFSLGAGLLDEDYTGQNQNGQITASEMGRRTTSAFAEVFVPLIGSGQNMPGVHRLELSLAGRYTDTKDTSKPSLARDFGDATDPKIGVLWAPISALSFRGTYGTSFRAPPLLQIDPTSAANFQIGDIPLPLFTGPLSTVLVLSGTSLDIKAETAETYTLGFDLQPDWRPGLKLSATYYFIDYTDRIAEPIFGADPIIAPADFPELLTRQPSAAVIERLLTQNNPSSTVTIDLSTPAAVAAAAAAFAADPDFWVYDLRRRNLSLSRQDGIDVGIDDRFDTHWGELRLGANLTYVLDYRQRLLESKPAVSIVDTVGFPVDLRGRVYAGLSRGGFDGTLGINYIDGYINSGDPANVVKVASWTTADLNVSYDFTREGHSGLLNGLRANLSVQNVFDQDPPFVFRAAADDRFGFDGQNANPLGRFIMFGISKQWGR
jgi:iron complex outermembrane recepter protein